MLTRLVCLAPLALAACATPPAPEPRVEYRPANIAVSAGCVVDAPAKVDPLLSIPDEQWNALAPGAKAQRFKAQAGLHMDYEDDLRVATKACPPATQP